MEQENFLSGGVSLLHTMVDGKHCYEVDEVLTSKPSDFGRKGDKLLMINNVETQHLHPKTFVRMLSSGSPLLTMHRASIDEGDNGEQQCSESESMKPYHKEKTVLNFCLSLVRETCLDEDEKSPPVPDECNRNESVSFTEEDLLLVSMTNTSVSIVQARGCDKQNPCKSCGGKGCTLDDFIVARKQCTISSVCRHHIKKKVEKNQVLIQSLLQKKICPENVSCSGKVAPHTSNSTTANITIYYYLSNAQDDFDKGVPVVLNFSGSTNYLKCVCENDRPVLIVQSCEKSRLQSICKDDPITWPFVFYLKTTKDDHRRFESALYNGWFIHTQPSGVVCMGTGTNYTESNFYVIVHLGNE